MTFRSMLVLLAVVTAAVVQIRRPGPHVSSIAPPTAFGTEPGPQKRKDPGEDFRRSVHFGTFVCRAAKGTKTRTKKTGPQTWPGVF